MYTAKSIGFDGEAPGLMLATIKMHVLVNVSTPAGFWSLQFWVALYSFFAMDGGKRQSTTAHGQR